MSVWEIGSEYHYQSLKNDCKTSLTFDVLDEVYTFSGRTAIETVLLNTPHVKKALLPSYCCGSMIEPFLSTQIEVSFYSVFWDNGLRFNVEIAEDVDLVLWCNFFGYKLPMPDFKSFVSRGGIIVEDITHSFLSDHPMHEQSHYLVASVRKWFPVLCGGYCASRVAAIQNKPKNAPSIEFIEKRRLAMRQKADYLKSGDDYLKVEYLANYAWASHWLAENYSGLKIDLESSLILSSIDVDFVKERRRSNALALYEFLNNHEEFTPMFDVTDIDCPLFVPLIFKNQFDRDCFRSWLINEKIYCPVHWTKPQSNCQSNLYDLELSLVCDQRYDVCDINKIIHILEKNNDQV